MLTGVDNLMKRDWLRWRRSEESTTSGVMILNPDFKDFFVSLNETRVRYLVVGGYAVALHGHPRYTKDIDIWVGSDEENARRLVQAIENIGFGSLGLEAEDFLVPDRIVQLGYPPSRIDLITTLPGVAFEECYPSGVEVSIDEVIITFIDLENLRANKRASGRYQDLADLEKLQ